MSVNLSELPGKVTGHQEMPRPLKSGLTGADILSQIKLALPEIHGMATIPCLWEHNSLLQAAILGMKLSLRILLPSHWPTTLDSAH